MIRCGRVATGVYLENKCIAEKTFKRYTTRAKQGGSQSSRDNSGSGKIHSAGATIRRANETRLAEEVRELFKGSWADYVSKASVIFYIHTRSSIECLFEEDKNKYALLNKNDSRLRLIPFTTYQPSVAELRRTQVNLFSIHLPICN
jgi:hypothetical protein